MISTIDHSVSSFTSRSFNKQSFGLFATFAQYAMIIDTILNEPKESILYLSKPWLIKIFTFSFEDLLKTAEPLTSSARESYTSLLFTVCKATKVALQEMSLDLIHCLLVPISKNPEALLSFQGWKAFAAIIATFTAHELALKILDESPEQAQSITYGAMTGTAVSFVMDHEIFIGTFTGACVGILADAAASCITYNRVSQFFIHQYKKLKIEERASKIKNFISHILPYFIFTTGTAVIYSQLKPIAHKILEEESSSAKSPTLRLVFLSSLIFEIGRSYLLPLSKIVFHHGFVSLKAIKDTGTIASWTPRIATTFIAITIASSTIKK